MIAEELYELLHQQPFMPVRLHLTGGTIYEIRHPEMAIVAQSMITIGLPPKNGSGIASGVIHCSLGHIVRVEPIEATTSEK